MNLNELYLKTAFCCMACDGNIADEEVALLRSVASESELFGGIDVQAKVNEYVKSINKEGMGFLSNYLREVASAGLTDEQALALISLAIDTIEADNNIDYSEISFFKKIRKRLSITDEKILEAMPNKEDYLLPDVEVPDDMDWSVSFDTITIDIK
jgi:uncharacterized tellurite resistance protein B-like protein